MKECLLCCEAQEYFSIGKCNHMNVCYLCTVKMRKKLEKTECSVCKVTRCDPRNRSIKLSSPMFKATSMRSLSKSTQEMRYKNE